MIHRPFERRKLWTNARRHGTTGRKRDETCECRQYGQPRWKHVRRKQEHGQPKWKTFSVGLQDILPTAFGSVCTLLKLMLKLMISVLWQPLDVYLLLARFLN